LRQQDAEFDALIAEVAVESELSPETARQELAGALRQAETRLLKTEMDRLAQSGLHSEEARLRYRELMARQEQLRRAAQADAGPV